MIRVTHIAWALISGLLLSPWQVRAGSCKQCLSHLESVHLLGGQKHWRMRNLLMVFTHDQLGIEPQTSRPLVQRTRYPLLLGGQKHWRMRNLLMVFTHDQLGNRTPDLSPSCPTRLPQCHELLSYRKAYTSATIHGLSSVHHYPYVFVITRRELWYMFPEDYISPLFFQFSTRVPHCRI
jgi:hypothetical protein